MGGGSVAAVKAAEAPLSFSFCETFNICVAFVARFRISLNTKQSVSHRRPLRFLMNYKIRAQ